MGKLEKIVRNVGMAIGSLALVGLSYVGTLEFAKMQRSVYSMEAFRDTMICYRIRGFDHHECWNNDSANQRDFYSKLYDALAFNDRK